MTYGRLDVFWPDGKIETYTLAAPNVSIGRSSGNTIVLDTDTISRYHFSITQEDGMVYLTDLDSVNGTYLDGAKLIENERMHLQGGEEITAGQLRMTYHAVDDAPTVPLMTVPDDTQRIERETAAFRVDLQIPQITVTPGAYTSVELLIVNTGSETGRYQVDVSGLPNEWVRINRPVLEIDKGEDALVLINVKPGRRSDTKPGEYQVMVRVRQQDKPENSIEAKMKVTIKPFSGFGVALANESINAGEAFQLHVHNQGSAPLGLKISGRDRQNKLVYRVNPATMTLAPGQHLPVRIDVRPSRARIFGPIVEHEAHILVQSTDLPYFTSALSGRVTDKAPLPTWGALVLGALLLLALALVGAGVSGFFVAAQQPSIDRLTVNNGLTEIASGTPIDISWEVRAARQIDVTINGQVTSLDEATVNSGFVQIPSTGLDGQVNIQITALNGHLRDSETRSITVYQPATIAAFDVAPESLFADVEQALTLTWEVANAQSVTITGLDSFLGAPLPPLQGESLVVTGIPVAPFSVKLSITDERGLVTELERPVRVEPALCAPLQPDTRLYNLPDTRARVVSVLQGNGQAQASGIDQTRTWLRFRLPDGSQAWGQRSGFDCLGTFDVERLRLIEVAAPTPTIAPPLTLIPQATPTFTPTPRTAPTTAPTPTGSG